MKSPKAVLVEVQKIENPLIRAEALFYLLAAPLLMAPRRGRKA